jgi:hypothetical protein
VIPFQRESSSLTTPPGPPRSHGSEPLGMYPRTIATTFLICGVPHAAWPAFPVFHCSTALIIAFRRSARFSLFESSSVVRYSSGSSTAAYSGIGSAIIRPGFGR